MQTINNRMTATQVADLFSLAVQLQVKAEESDDRDTAILAYSIQNACSNLTESRREFWAADATINNLELKITDMAVQLANAESKCRALAAENGRCKFEISRCHQTVDEMFKNRDKWVDKEWLSAIWSTSKRLMNETPATDAFLAEVRAQGVEMFAKNAEGAEQGNGLMKAIARRATKFADQLRKGAVL